MRLLALITFSMHTIFELIFGISIYLRGASSAQSLEQITVQSVQMTIAFRFMGAALTAMGILGLVIIFWAGVKSQTARFVAIGFATFHGLGALGSIFTAAPSFEAYQRPLSLGALILHALLSIGFVIIASQKK